MQFIHGLDQVIGGQHDYLGGKGDMLSRLRVAGFPVPPGFVVTTAAYRAFMTANGLEALIVGAADNPDPAQTRALLETAPMPPDIAAAICGAYDRLDVEEVAVRSSAVAEDGDTASFAGQFDTVLGITGCDALLVAVRHCWVSLWGDRALAYRRHMYCADDTLAMAVVVQEMISTAQSGVVFTLDPVSGDRDVTVVEAVSGVGESLADGSTTPQRYVLHRQHGFPVPATGALDAMRLEAVVHLAWDVESWAGQPQDVEWALDHAGRVYLLQARPITVIGSATSEPVARWTRDNVGEVVPEALTPLSWSVLNPLSNRAFAHMLHRLGLGIASDAVLFDLFYGRVYLNQTLFQAVLSGFYPSHAGWRALPRITLTGLRALWLLYRLQREAKDVSQSILTRRHSDVMLDLTALAPEEVLSELDEWRHLAMEAMKAHVGVTVMATLLYQALDKCLARWSTGTDTAATVTTGLTGIHSAEAGRALADLAEWVCSDDALCVLVRETPPRMLAARVMATEAGRALWTRIEAFLAEYGHMAVQEFELYAPRWRDDPTIVLSTLQAQLSTASRSHVDLTSVRIKAVARIERELGLLKRSIFRLLLCWSQVFTSTRENLKYNLVMAHSRVRDLYLALAAHLVAAGSLSSTEEIFFLTADEVMSLARGTLLPGVIQTDIANRRRKWQSDRQTRSPFALAQFDNGRLATVTPVPPSSGRDSQLLYGLPASPGSCTGRARVVLTPTEGAEIVPGEVLVAPATSPGWAPMLTVAGALITEIGGTLSHGAIIAREYGLPAVLNVPDATQRIRTGSLVHVDGSRGVVWVLEEDQ